MSTVPEKIQLILFEPVVQVVKDMAKGAEGKGDAEIFASNLAQEIIQSALQFQPCILAISITDNARVAECINILKRLEKPIKSGAVKTIVTSNLKNRQLASLVAACGVQDFLEEPIQARTLTFKAGLLIRAAKSMKVQAEKNKNAQEKIVFKKSEKKPEDNADLTKISAGGMNKDGKQATIGGKDEAEDATPKDVRTQSKPALKVGEDLFLFRKTKPIKTGKKYVIELEGPPPQAGRWKPHPPGEDGKPCWRWSPEDEQGMSEKKKDGWIQTGDQPEFQPKSGKWRFVSEKPKLELKKNGLKYAAKFELSEDGEEVVCAEDSEETEERLGKAWEKTLTKQVQAAEKPPRQPAAKTGLEKGEDKEKETKEAKPQIEKDKPLPPKANTLSLVPKAAPEKIKSPETEEKEAAEHKPGNALDRQKQKQQELIAQRKAALEKVAAEKEVAAAERAKKTTAEKLIRDKTPVPGVEKDPPEEKDGVKKEPEQKNGLEKPVAARQLGEKVPDDKEKRRADFLAKMRAKMQKPEEEKEEEVELGQKEKQKPEKAYRELVEKEKLEQVKVAHEKIEKEKKERQAKEKIENLEKAKIDRNTLLDKSAEKRKLDPHAEKLMGQRALLKQKAKELIDKPLPDKLTPEEEQELRKRYDAEDDESVTPVDLARKRRLDAIKKLKDKQKELEDALGLESEDEPEFTDFHKKTDNSFSQASHGIEKKRNFNAHDSDIPEDAELEESYKRQKRLTKFDGKEEKIDITGKKYFFLPLASIRPPSGAWEHVKPFFVYIGLNTHTKGFEDLAALLPIWIFKGDIAPELLSRSKQWKFLNDLPAKYETVEEIPEDVVSYLNGVRDRIRKEKTRIPGEPEESAAAQTVSEPETEGKNEPKDQDDQSDSKSQTEEETNFRNSKKKEEDPESSEDSAVSESIKKRKKEKEDKLALLRKRAENLSGETLASEEKDEKSSPEDSEKSNEPEAKGDPVSEHTDSLEQGSENKDSEINQETESVSGEGFRKKKRNAEPEETADSEKQTKTVSDEFASQAEGLREKFLNKTDDLTQKLEALRNNVQKSADALAEDGTAAASLAKKSTSSQVEESLEKPNKPQAANDQPDITEAKKERKKLSSAALDFLERRKLKPQKEPLPTPEPAKEKSTAYLGVFLALSDAVNSERGLKRSCMSIIKAIQASYGDCMIAILHPEDRSGFFDIRFSTHNEMPEGSQVPKNSNYCYPIFSGGKEGGKNLGYLFLNPNTPREIFYPEEVEIVQKVIKVLWVVLLHDEENKGAKQSAA